jgi:hypothetical protein
MIILSAGAGSVEFIVDNSSFADFHLENSKATKIIYQLKLKLDSGSLCY